MLAVLRSYTPFLAWLVLALAALLSPLAQAEGPLPPLVRHAQALIEAGRWEEAARLRLPEGAREAWAPEALAKFFSARGHGAARAGYPAMAQHALECLEALRERMVGAGRSEVARRIEAQAGALQARIDAVGGRGASPAEPKRSYADIERD